MIIIFSPALKIQLSLSLLYHMMIYYIIYYCYHRFDSMNP